MCAGPNASCRARQSTHTARREISRPERIRNRPAGGSVRTTAAQEMRPGEFVSNSNEETDGKQTTADGFKMASSDNPYGLENSEPGSKVKGKRDEGVWVGRVGGLKLKIWLLTLNSPGPLGPHPSYP
jgi:hypothetical protein